MYSEKNAYVGNIIKEENILFKKILETNKVHLIFTPPASGVENFIPILSEDLRKRVKIIPMGIFWGKDFTEKGKKYGRNIDAFNIRGIVNFGDFGIKRIPEDFLEQVQNMHGRAIIFAHSSKRMRENGIDTDEISFRWMGIEYVSPNILTLEKDEIKRKNEALRRILNFLKIDFEMLGLHSEDFWRALGFIDNSSLENFIEGIKNLPILKSLGHRCASLISVVVLLIFHQMGMDYSRGFQDFISDWSVLGSEHRELLAAQISLELGIGMEDVIKCLNSINSENSSIIVEYARPFLEGMAKKIRGSVEKLDCSNFRKRLGIGNIPLPGEGDGEMDHSIISSAEKIRDLLSAGSVVILYRDRHEKGSMIVSLIKILCGEGVFLLKDPRILGIKWATDGGKVLLVDQELNDGDVGVIALKKKVDLVEAEEVEKIGPVKIEKAKNNDRIFYISFSWERHIVEMVKRYLDIFAGDKYNENDLENIVSISNGLLSRAYIASLAFSIYRADGMEDPFHFLAGDPVESIVTYILEKSQPEQMLLLRESAFYPVMEYLIDLFKPDRRILEMYENGYMLVQEISDAFNSKLITGDFLDNTLDSILKNVFDLASSLNVPQDFMPFDSISKNEKMDIAVWYTMITRMNSSPRIVEFIYGCYLEKLGRLRNFVSYATPALMLREKNTPGIRYTPVSMVFDLRPMLVPYVILEYGRNTLEVKIVKNLIQVLLPRGNFENEMILKYVTGDFDPASFQSKEAIHHYLSGMYMLENNDPENALGEFDSAINKNRLFSESFLMKSVAFLNMEKNEKSIVKKKKILETGLESVNNSISIDPGNYVSYLIKGRIYYREGRIEIDRMRKVSNFNLSKVEYEKGIKIKDNFSPLLSGMGEALLHLAFMEKGVEKMKKYLNDSVEYFRKALDNDPGDANALYGLSTCYLEISRFERNLNVRLELLKKSLEGYEGCLSLKESAEAHNGKGNSLLSLARYEKDVKKRREIIESSIREYEKSMAMNPEIISNYIGLGNAMLELSRIENAIESKRDILNRALKYFENGLNIESLNTHLHYGKAEAILELSRTFEEKNKKMELLNSSLNEYERCIKIDSEFAHAYNGAGNVFLDMYMIEENRERKEEYLSKALKYFEKAISIRNDYPSPYNGRSICYAIMAKEEKKVERKREFLMKSIADLDEVIKLDPFFSLAYHNKGNRLINLSEIEDNVERKREMIQEAIRKYEEAISMDPTLKHSYNGLGNSFYMLAGIEKSGEKRRKFLEKAIENYNKALSLDPSYSTARKNLDLCRALLERL